MPSCGYSRYRNCSKKNLKNKEFYTERKRQCVGAEESKTWTLSLFCSTRWSHKPVWWQHSMLQPSSRLIMSLHATSSCWELVMCKFLSSVTLAEYQLWPTLWMVMRMFSQFWDTSKILASANSSTGMETLKQFSVMCVLTHRHTCREEKEKVAHFWWCWYCSRWKRRRKKLKYFKVPPGLNWGSLVWESS